eukprot:symbB.v1.2.011346.t1/scaffold745.1/size165919/3
MECFSSVSSRSSCTGSERFPQNLASALAKFGPGAPSVSSGESSLSTRSQGEAREDATEMGSEDASFQSSVNGQAAAILAGRTTVMLKNVPLKYTQRKLLRELLAAGFQGKMDFIYLPLDPRTRSSRGFAFCNFSSPQAAECFYSCFHRRFLKAHSAEAPLEVAAAEVQGFEENVEHYFEVKESRKGKGRDTFGCPIFLRPLPAKLLAQFRQESDETESSGSPQLPLQPQGAVPMLKGQTQSHQGYLVQGVGTPMGRTPWQIGSESPSMHSSPPVATWNQLHNMQQDPGPVGMNEGKQLNVRNAWDAVQHTSCGSLADELRGIASQKLKLLKSGQKLPDDVQLPLTDDALRALFRKQRHELKERWEEQAVGDEEVRKEYWQELKETLAREEIQVRQQNGRMADQQLAAALKLWQDWLDNPDGTVEEGEKISADLGKLLDQLPSNTVTRGGRSAIEAAARRVAVARTAVSATVEQSAEAQRRALAWGEQAAKSEGAVRSELEAIKASIKEAVEHFRAAGQEKEAKTVELQGKAAELEDGLKQLSSISTELEEAKVRGAELKALVKAGEERELSLQQDLEATRALAAKTSAEHLASQRSNEAAAEAASLQTVQLQEELREAQAELQRQKEQLEEERQMLILEREGHREKHQTHLQELHAELHVERQQLTAAHDNCHVEHQQMLCSVRQELEEERKKHSESKEGTKGQLLQHVRHIGTLEGKVTGLQTEANFLKGRIGELQAILKESEAHMVKQGQAISGLKKELEKAKLETGRTKSEGEERLYQLRREGHRKLQERWELSGKSLTHRLTDTSGRLGGIWSETRTIFR